MPFPLGLAQDPLSTETCSLEHSVPVIPILDLPTFEGQGGVWGRMAVCHVNFAKGKFGPGLSLVIRLWWKKERLTHGERSTVVRCTSAYGATF